MPYPREFSCRLKFAVLIRNHADQSRTIVDLNPGVLIIARWTFSGNTSAHEEFY